MQLLDLRLAICLCKVPTLTFMDSARHTTATGKYSRWHPATRSHSPKSLGQYTNGKFLAFNTDVETVGIGTTVVRMNVMANTLYAVVDTSRSTRLLYTGCTIENVNSPQGSANVVFEAFDENNNSLGSNLRTVSGMNIGATLSVTGDIDLQSIGALQRAFTVSVIVTPTNVSNYGTSSDAVMVVHGPTPYA